MKGGDLKSFVDIMNSLGAAGEPFLFLLDFDMIRPEIHKLDNVPKGILFSTPVFSNVANLNNYSKPFSFNAEPVEYNTYLKAFTNVQDQIRLGKSYLVNLTFPAKLETDLTLEEIFRISVAKFKLLYHNQFVVFSPERFVRIVDGIISSFPMKGTIDASVKDAERIIIQNEKEKAEHHTIVDLIRNDLSIVSDDVNVTRFRYIDRIKKSGSELLQVSSEISGKLKGDYKARLGDIITGMLPAGSVTGAPKQETMRIIRESEKYERGWYTGIFGVFDGIQLDSAVMIRFIENISGQFVYKSGGGITCMSEPISEYNELISKVYVPLG